MIIFCFAKILFDINELKGMLNEKLNIEFAPLNSVNVECITCTNICAHLSLGSEAVEMSLITWNTEDPKLLKKCYHLLQKVIVIVRRLPGDGDLPHAAADGVFWLLLTFVGLGQEDK